MASLKSSITPPELHGDRSVEVAEEEEQLLSGTEYLDGRSPSGEPIYRAVRSPRVPRKRLGTPANLSKEEMDYDNEYELHADDLHHSTGKMTTQPSSPSVVVTPNSPSPGRRATVEGALTSPNHSTGSSVYHRHVKCPQSTPTTAQWVPLDMEHCTPPNETTTRDDEGPAKGKREIDVSLYTTKKNVAQGMLDIALLSANCSQLKYLLFHYERDAGGTSTSGGSIDSSTSPIAIQGPSWLATSLDFYFAINLLCIGLSIFLQVVVGILLILNSRHNIYVHRYQRVADSFSNLILITVFIITVVNVFLSVFISAR